MSNGDAGEGLVDAESRLAERIEEREQERQRRGTVVITGDPEQMRLLESYRLARSELQNQQDVTTNPIRSKQLVKALAELERRIAKLSA